MIRMYKISGLLCHIMMIAFFFTGMTSTTAQSFQEDYKKFVNVYMEAENISYDVDVKGYGADNKVKERNKSSIRRRGNLFRTETNGIITIANEDCALMINENKEMIICQPTMETNDDEELSSASTMEELDELFKYAETEIKYIGKSKWGKQYSLEMNSMGIKTMDIHFSSESGFLRRIEYKHDMEVSTISKTIIEYQDFSTAITAKLDLSIFSEKKYVSISGKEVSLTPEYADYELIISDFN